MKDEKLAQAKCLQKLVESWRISNPREWRKYEDAALAGAAALEREAAPAPDKPDWSDTKNYVQILKSPVSAPDDAVELLRGFDNYPNLTKAAKLNLIGDTRAFLATLDAKGGA